MQHRIGGTPPDIIDAADRAVDRALLNALILHIAGHQEQRLDDLFREAEHLLPIDQGYENEPSVGSAAKERLLNRRAEILQAMADEQQRVLNHATGLR